MLPANKIDDVDVQRAVQEELEWSADVDHAGIGVAVEDGTVALSGEVDSYSERLAATRAALRVRGVTAVVDNLMVHSKYAGEISRTDLAKELERALESASEVPRSVKVVIDEHGVRLIGEVEWDYQRRAAKRAVQYVSGVRAVTNMITLSDRPSSEDTAENIRKALVRNAQIDARAIDVTTVGTKVTLTGTVRSWQEKSQAGAAAWSSPDVSDVENRIEVRAD